MAIVTYTCTSTSDLSTVNQLNNNGMWYRVRCDIPWVEVNSADSFDPLTISGETATLMYTAGFLLFLTPWATAWGFKQLLKLLR
jgi:hypothetical protein